MIFQKDQKWNWDECQSESIIADLEWEDDEENTIIGLTNLEETAAATNLEEEVNTHSDHQPDNSEYVHHDSPDGEGISSTEKGRIQRPPIWMQDNASD